MAHRLVRRRRRCSPHLSIDAMAAAGLAAVVVDAAAPITELPHAQ
jgi:hypothetical protein